jgi:hypothetical protein
LSEGIQYFPDHEQLNVCLGVSHMNIANYEAALSFFLKFQHSKQALELIINCYRAMNDVEKASFYQKKLKP